MATALTHLPRALAGVLAATARESGHRIATNTAVSGLDWPADVLVAFLGRRPTILQVAPLAADGEEIRAQIAQALQHGLDIVWFTPEAHDPPWLPHVPAVRVIAPARPGEGWHAQAAVQRLTTDACTCGPAWGHGIHRAWSAPEPVPLAAMLDDLLAGRLVHATVQPDLPGRRFTAWARNQDVRAEADHLRTLAAGTRELTDAAKASTPYIPLPEGRPAAPLGRLLEAARRWARHKTGVVCHIETASADWMAGGFVVTPSRRPPGSALPPVTALVRPLPHEADWTSELSTVPVLVGSPEEYFTLRRTAPAAAQIHIL
ncbi:hypothetical protein [Streptomyces sp. NPDC001165]|uniref:hypothetical protein n=1 Tax=Streptomyces sp. NPDC001165 TaxID=3364546 RepID=UPI0036BBB001